jgi:tRNA(fMet)-specific endonuclease VapC
MPAYMLDTDISWYIMSRTDAGVLRKLQTVAVEDDCVSAITRAELEFGVQLSPRRKQDQDAVDRLLRYVSVLDFPREAAVDYGVLRAYLKARGAMIGANDLFIAAHARRLGLTLVTNNTRDLGRVQGLKMENWSRT